MYIWLFNILCCISCACTSCNSILDQPRITGFPAHQHPCYKIVNSFTYWPVLGFFNSCNILKLSHKATSSEENDKIHQVVLYVISKNMAALVQTYEYDAINTTYTTTMVYYVIEFMSNN